jgi:DNA ligase D-like protein (predicted ligase)
MSDALEKLTAAERNGLKRTGKTRWSEPMLATLTHDRFSDENWIFERKLDGVRAIASRTQEGFALRSRNRKKLDRTFPELAEALAARRGDFVIDGEIITFSDGTSSFARLQQRLQVKDPSDDLRARVAVFYYVFDIMRYEGWDLSNLPLRRRKSVLKSAIAFDDPVRLCIHRNAEGERLFREACDKGWEGLVAKRADSVYRHGRSRAWLKFKCENRQELVIAGYTDPEGSRLGFGALLLGYYRGADLCYAGRVGTGFDNGFLQSFGAQLREAEICEPAFPDPPQGSANVHWTEPRFVGEVAFTEWTKAGKLRHPRFLGLRTDKSARDVVREDDRTGN